MRNAITLALSMLLTSSLMAFAESGSLGVTQVETSPASVSFAELNSVFIKTYSGLADKNQKATRPILITTGATWDLLCEDGTTKSAPRPNPVDAQLKAVSHVCAYLYAIAEIHWRDPGDTKWIMLMTEAQTKLDAAIADTEKVSWKSEAWPGGEERLKVFVRDSLKTARELTASSLAKNDITREDFQSFATRYTPAIRATFYLNSLSTAYDLLKVLRQWKQEIGPEAWDRMRVLCAAGKGRTTAGFTPDTNPSVVILAAVMTPEKLISNVMMAPAATTNSEALDGLALALTSNKLADVFKEDPQAAWFYASLKQPDIPVALGPLRDAVRDLVNGTKNPILQAFDAVNDRGSK